jgi:hypothetical protein
MEAGRRTFLTALLPLVALLGSGAARAHQRSHPSPPTPAPANPPPQPTLMPDPSVDDYPSLPIKPALHENQKQIQKDTDRLFTLAQELKERVDKTDSATELSLPLIQKAGEIEKLARQIKNLAKG